MLMLSKSVYSSWGVLIDVWKKLHKACCDPIGSWAKSENQNKYNVRIYITCLDYYIALHIKGKEVKELNK